jgi:hypothetical protein
MIEKFMAVAEQAANPLSQFLYVLEAPETKRQVPNRLGVVFDFLGFHGNLDAQAVQFMALYKEESVALVQDRLMEFISYQEQRSQRGEISQATIPNYLIAIKLFCEMNDIQVSWKKNPRGVPLERSCAPKCLS